MRLFVLACARPCVRVPVRACVRPSGRSCFCPCVYVSVRAFVCPFLRAGVRPCFRPSVCPYPCPRVRPSARVGVRVCYFAGRVSTPLSTRNVYSALVPF